MSVTDYLGLSKPAAGASGFDTNLNNNFQTIDDVLGQAARLRAVAGENIAQFDVCTIKADGKIWKADADSYTTMGIIGIAESAITSGATGTIRMLGYFYNDLWAWSGARTKLYLSTTAGALSETAADGAPFLAVALDTDKIFLSPYVFNQQHKLVRIGALAASDDFYVFIEDLPVTIVGVEILCDTTTSGSDGSNNWQFTLYNLTQANTIAVDDTNGNEITADTPWEVLITGNADLESHDILELRAVLTGAPTSLASAEISVVIEYELRI